MDSVKYFAEYGSKSYSMPPYILIRQRPDTCECI